MSTTAFDGAGLSPLYGPPGGRPIPYAGSSASIARDEVRRTLSSWPSDRLDDAVLLVTELVSNAVIHGQPGIELAVAPTERGVRVSVTDTGVEMPRRKPVWAGGHRGLEIVEMLSDAWGYDELSTGGKTVWFELSR